MNLMSKKSLIFSTLVEFVAPQFITQLGSNLKRRLFCRFPVFLNLWWGVTSFSDGMPQGY